MTNDDHSATEAGPERETATGEPSDATDPSADETLAQALAAIASQFRVGRGQLDRLLTIQIDRLKLKARSGVFWVVAGVLIVAAVVTAVAVAVIYLIAGVSGGFTELLGGRAWAGDLAAGALALLLIALVAVVAVRRRQKSELKRLMRKYESGGERR